MTFLASLLSFRFVDMLHSNLSTTRAIEKSMALVATFLKLELSVLVSLDSPPQLGSLFSL